MLLYVVSGLTKIYHSISKMSNENFDNYILHLNVKVADLFVVKLLSCLQEQILNSNYLCKTRTRFSIFNTLGIWDVLMFVFFSAIYASCMFLITVESSSPHGQYHQ